MGRSEQGKQRFAPLNERAEFYCEHCAASMGHMTRAVWEQIGSAHLHCMAAAEEPLPAFVQGALSQIPVQLPSRLWIRFQSLRPVRWIRKLAGHNSGPHDAPAGTGGAIEALVCLSSAIGQLDTLGRLHGIQGQDLDTVRIPVVTASSALSWWLVNQVNVSRVLTILGSVERMGADLKTIQEAVAGVTAALEEVRRTHQFKCIDHSDPFCPVDNLNREVIALQSRV